MNPSRRRSGDSRMALHRGDDRHVVREDAEVRDPVAAAPSAGSPRSTAPSSRIRRRRTRPAGPGCRPRPAARQGASRRSGCRRLAPWRRAGCRFEPGTRIMSPNEVKMTPGRPGQRDGVVDAAHRDDAHRATGAVHQLDRGREEVLDAVPVDRVGVAPADLHELVVPIACQLGDAGQRARGPPPGLGTHRRTAS